MSTNGGTSWSAVNNGMRINTDITVFAIDPSNPQTVYAGTAGSGVFTSSATPLNGTCGSSNGQAFTIVPSINLCFTGSASAVTGSGPWSWTCSISNGGSSAICSAPLGMPLNLTFSGTGGGSVSSDMSCTSGSSCPSQIFTSGITVNLLATPDAVSTFNRWTGDCTNTTKSCTVTMNSVKSITAAFIAAPKAMILSTGYTSFSNAYTAASGSPTTIKLLVDVLHISSTVNKSLVLSGGYLPDYSRSSHGFTTLQGTFTIGSGSVVMDRVVVK
jgi:hypothetical protein